jgi:signal transduction histidine kinase
MATYDILLLGDGSHLFRTIAWVLEYKGYKVRAAASPEAALEVLVKKNYDLVIAKLNMGELDGVEVLKRAKRLNPEVKVIVVSGNHEVTFPREAYQIEVDDYLLMPVSPTELWRRVSHCLESLDIVDLVPATGLAAKTATAVNDRALERLMMVFHDLRSSMVSNAASMKLLVRGTFGEVGGAALEKLQEISGDMDRLISFTEEFMAKAFSCAGDQEMEKEMLDLRHDVVAPVLEELGVELRNHRINLDNRLERRPAAVIPVKGSKLWLKRVFRNLVNNAIRHGGAGCTIVIDWQKQGSNCRLNVHNTGKPVPEEYRSLLFSDFAKKMRRAQGSGEGMGLGLYLSRDIVSQYGGDLHYEPRQDGSNFVMTLPHG